jgi:hypothetical protein
MAMTAASTTSPPGEHRPHRRAGVLQVVDHEPQLQADVGEHEGLQQDDERVPHLTLLHARLVAEARRPRPHDEPRRHDRDDARRLEVLGAEVRGERQDEPEHGLQPRVAQPPANVDSGHREPHADGRPDARAVEEEQDRPVDERVCAGHRRDGDREQRERRRVVHEALAGQQREDVAPQAELAADGQGAHRIGRGDRGAEHDRGAHRQRRHDPGRHRGRGEGGGDHEQHTEPQDRHQQAHERRERERERRRVDQRRDEDREDDVRLQLEPRGAWDERRGAGQNGDHERRLQLSPTGVCGHHDRAEHDQDELDAVHARGP